MRIVALVDIIEIRIVRLVEFLRVFAVLDDPGPKALTGRRHTVGHRARGVLFQGSRPDRPGPRCDRIGTRPQLGEPPLHVQLCLHRRQFSALGEELSSWPETYGYYNGLGKEFGNAESLGNLGQGAFRAANGDVVVRKDWKVLLVNIAGLPSQFGNPPTASTDVAYTVADVILACWAGD
jgi:hypothetical protein